MARKKKGGGDVPGYSWMDTYGDMITLVLCFFVLLFASSSLDAKKAEQLVSSLSGRAVPIAYPIDPGPANMSDPVVLPNQDTMQDPYRGANDPSPNPYGTPIPDPTPVPETHDDPNAETDVQFDLLYQMLTSYINDNGMNDSVDLKKEGIAITMSFLDSVFFDSGKADLLPHSKEILLQVTPFLEQFQTIIDSIRIEGHTDNVPIRNALFPDNWWLSVYRAGNVNEFIRENSTIDPSKFSCEGRGEYHPIDTNETAEGRARNRRVEIIISELVVPASK